MIANKKVFAIKLVHSMIFFLMVACLMYVFYCAVVRRYDWLLLVALSAIVIEGIVLLINHGKCPFTDLAKKYGDQKGSVTDIYLPAWYARNTFKIATIVVIIELIWLAWDYFH